MVSVKCCETSDRCYGGIGGEVASGWRPKKALDDATSVLEVRIEGNTFEALFLSTGDTCGAQTLFLWCARSLRIWSLVGERKERRWRCAKWRKRSRVLEAVSFERMEVLKKMASLALHPHLHSLLI